MISHHHVTLPSFGRGSHLVTIQIVDSLQALLENGLLNIFIKHTSAGLTINENAAPDVRIDFERFFNDIVKENMPLSFYKLLYIIYIYNL